MRVIVLIGLPGSGKSTWAAGQGITILSSDGVRELLSDDITNQDIHGAVFSTMRYLLRRRLQLGAPSTMIDATNLLPVHRKPWIKLAQAYGAEAEAVYFATALETCLSRNAGRARVVPAEAIANMASRLRPPTTREGFQTIHRIPSPE